MRKEQTRCVDTLGYLFEMSRHISNKNTKCPCSTVAGTPVLITVLENCFGLYPQVDFASLTTCLGENHHGKVLGGVRFGPGPVWARVRFEPRSLFAWKISSDTIYKSDSTKYKLIHQAYRHISQTWWGQRRKCNESAARTRANRDRDQWTHEGCETLNHVRCPERGYVACQRFRAA